MEQKLRGFESLYIPNELIEEINKIAEYQNTTFNDLIISIIDEFLQKQKFTLD